MAEHSSISLAAQSVHIAQPALSRQMQALEEQVGVLLMERTGRGIRLTEAGMQLLGDARQLLEDSTHLRERAQRASRGETGHLSIAAPVMQSLSHLIGNILKTYYEEKPGVALTLHHMLSDEQLKMLADGRLDAGFLLFRPQENALLAGLPVFSDRMLLAYPAQWTWPSGRPRRLKDLQHAQFIWLPRTAAPTWHDQLIHCFFNAGFVPRTSLHGVDAGSMLSLVAAGLGCTVLPESAKSRAPDTVAFLPLQDLTIRQNWELVWRTDRVSPSLKRFIELAANLLAGQKRAAGKQTRRVRQPGVRR